MPAIVPCPGEISSLGYIVVRSIAVSPVACDRIVVGAKRIQSQATGLTFFRETSLMIAFHLIISAYGFWLPNDPRGSWSDFVGSWELLKFGPATKVNDRRSYAKDTHDVALRRAAKQALKFPPVRFNDAQRIAIARGFEIAYKDADYRCAACCIGYDHAHFAILKHAREITTIAGHFKSCATRSLTDSGIHPLTGYVGKRGGLPTPWSEGCWKVFIDTSEQLDLAIKYIERHPAKECLPAQQWNFVSPSGEPASLLAGES
jgi:hypothetical protein